MENNWNLFTTSCTSNGNGNLNGFPAAWDFWDFANNFRHPSSAAVQVQELAPPPQPHSLYSDPHLTCLNLGKRHQFEDVAGKSSPPKRGKSYGSGGGGSGGGYSSAAAILARCQVEGCQVVLVNAKDYHRRHKVCETHAKAPKVVVHGVEQRFCQQCSRFHAVSEFDDSKRSCRRRLAGHNLRRRKNPADHSRATGRRYPYSQINGECALSLLSSKKNYEYDWINQPTSLDYLPLRSSTALRELIAENRAALARQLSLNAAANPSRKIITSGSQEYFTLDFMQGGSGSEFGLLPAHGKPGEEEECPCPQPWKLPVGY